jgi:hypothetical protein
MCDQFFGYAWDGFQCVGVSGCNCNGDDCMSLPLELEECQAAHADCGEEPDGCVGLDVQACSDNNLCMTIFGSALGMNNQGDCLEKADFLGCDDAMLCAEVLTWGCDINATPYLFGNSCLPEGFMPCDGPGNNIPPEC